jgi:hypothetical protein
VNGQPRPVLAALARQLARALSGLASPPCDNGCGQSANVQVYDQHYCTDCWLKLPAAEIRRRAGLPDLPE